MLLTLSRDPLAAAGRQMRSCGEACDVAALVTISVGLVLPRIIAEAAGQVDAAARRLATGTLSDLAKAMQSLAAAPRRPRAPESTWLASPCTRGTSST